MEDLKNIQRFGSWSNCVNDLNTNFYNLDQNLSEIEKDGSKSKGLFPTLTVLRNLHPNSEYGDWALVGTEFPATIYIWNGAWVSTNKKTGNFDLTKFATSVKISAASVPGLLRTSLEWIYTNNNGTSWSTVNSSGDIKIAGGSSPSYEIRPKSLIYGDQGELLVSTTTDAYLKEFIPGASYVKCYIKTPYFEVNYTHTASLSWIIDKTFYKQLIDGQQQDRDPIIGDTFSVTFYYKNLKGEVKFSRKIFKFIA